MRRLFLALLLLLASVLLALWFRDHDGFVVVTAGPWTLQTSLIVFIGALAALMLAVWLGVGLLRRLLGAPGGVRRWFGLRRTRRVQRQFLQGLMLLAEGSYPQAEKALAKRATQGDAPLIHYLGAAVAAQRQGDLERRDDYLSRADRAQHDGRLAVGLMQAQLQLEAGQRERALASLVYMHEQAPNNRRALELLLSCAEALEDWERLADLLPEARRLKLGRAENLERLQRRVAVERLAVAARRGDLEKLQGIWQSQPPGVRDSPDLLADYAGHLIRLGAHAPAEKLLRSALDKHYLPALARRYGEVDLRPADRQLSQVERWLKQRPEDPALLQAAGRHALRAGLWGRARSYLEAAAARTDEAQCHRLLAALYERLGEDEAAARAYRRALELALGPTPPELEASLEGAPPRVLEAAKGAGG